MNGWFKVHRKLFESEIWRPEFPEPYDIRSAWIELVGIANHETKEIIVGRDTLTVKRGQKFTSIRKLAKRFHWSKNRTLRYINLLEKLGMINKIETHNGTLLTIINYEVYQGGRDTSGDTYGDTHGDTYGDTYGDTGGTQTRIYKNNKEIEEDIYMASPDETPEDDQLDAEYEEDEDEYAGYVIPQKDEDGNWIDPEW